MANSPKIMKGTRLRKPDLYLSSMPSAQAFLAFAEDISTRCTAWERHSWKVKIQMILILMTLRICTHCVPCDLPYRISKTQETRNSDHTL